MLDSTKLITAAIAIIGLAMAFVAGQAVEERSSKKENEQLIAQRLGAISAERDALRAQATTAVQQNKEASATVVALRDKMKKQSAMGLRDEADLRLYRKIANLDDTETRGLVIDEVTMSRNSETGNPTLNIRLIQTQGRNRIKGTVGASIKPDTGKRIKLVDPGDKNAPDFNLRFFQTVHIPVPKTTGVMDELEITVQHGSKTQKPVVRTFPWDKIKRLR